jgi:hypothetical protein
MRTLLQGTGEISLGNAFECGANALKILAVIVVAPKYYQRKKGVLVQGLAECPYLEGNKCFKQVSLQIFVQVLVNPL